MFTLVKSLLRSGKHIMGNVNIRFVNDGKDKYQSYEAHLDVNDFEAMHHCTCSFVGYGSTELESYDNLSKAIENLYGVHTRVNDYVMNHRHALWEQLQQRWYRDVQQTATLFTVTRGESGIVLTPKTGDIVTGKQIGRAHV